MLQSNIQPTPILLLTRVPKQKTNNLKYVQRTLVEKINWCWMVNCKINRISQYYSLEYQYVQFTISIPGNIVTNGQRFPHCYHGYCILLTSDQSFTNIYLPQITILSHVLDISGNSCLVEVMFLRNFYQYWMFLCYRFIPSMSRPQRRYSLKRRKIAE